MRGLVKGGRNDGGVLTGDAVAGDVRAGKTFYNTDPLVYLTGNLTVRTGDNATTAITSAGTILKFKAPAGIYDGTSDYVTYTDADYLAANIRYSKTLFDTAGTYVSVTGGSTVLVSSSTTASTNSETYTALKTCVVVWDAQYTIGAYYYSTSDVSLMQYRLYNNGTAVGSIFSAGTTAAGSNQTLYFTAGSTCTWRILTTTATATAYLYDADVKVNGGFTIT